MLKALLVAAAAIGLAPIAVAQVPVAPLPDIYESYNDCFVATADGVDAGKLEALGWKLADINGKPGADPKIFGHAARAPLIIVGGQGDNGVCAVVAKLESAAAFDELVSAWQGIKFDKKGEASFMAEGHPVMIAKTGSKGAPAVRLAVGPRVDK